MMRDLVRIRCCSVFSGVKLQRTNCQCGLPNAPCARETDLRLPESNCNSQTANAGSPTLPAPGRLISGHLPASGPLENQTDSDSSLSPLPCRLAWRVFKRILMRFLARLVGRPRFRLGGSVDLAVGLAIGGVVSMAGEVAVGLSGWSL